MLPAIILLSISLSIDALGIGTSYGLRGISIPPATKLIISIQSILIMALSLVCGKWLGNILPPDKANILGVLILIFMGVWILFQGVFSNKKSAVSKVKTDDTIKSFIIKSLGITIQIVRTPQFCDLDKSSSIEPFEAIYLGFALSIDSFGAGIGSGAIGISSPAIPILTSLCQFIFLSTGCFLGKKLKFFSSVSENLWVCMSGIILILVGILRLF